ncbi:MAG: bifunctional enoyl-CoA hydratase/phosphate acetyltransferase [Methyloligellaceae bacterium]
MSTEKTVQCPSFLLDAAAGQAPLRTAIVNAGTPIVMESARDAANAGILEPVLFGDRGDIESCARDLGWDLTGLEVVDANDESVAASEAAFAAGSGDVGAIMKGHVHTNTFMRAVLNKEAGLRTGRRLSHLFMMTAPAREEPLFITDAALNVHPDEETLQVIVANVVSAARAIGIAQPKIALLSATEEATEAVPSSMQAARLNTWAEDNVDDADVFGPLAFDLAVSPASAALKAVSHPVAGNADAIVVPDIVTGNALFKLMVHFLGACAAGVVLGARVPVLLTSRADPPAARLASAALAAVFATYEAGRMEAEASAGDDVQKNARPQLKA